MKQYPEGTRWAVRIGHPAKFDNTWARNIRPRNDGLALREDRWLTESREEALSVMYEWRSSCCPEATLVRIPPPRPKRSVEERIADAIVAERTRVHDHLMAIGMHLAAIALINELDRMTTAGVRQPVAAAQRARTAERLVEERIAAAVRERTEAILTEWQAPLSESKRRPIEQPFAEWLRDLIAGKVSA